MKRLLAAAIASFGPLGCAPGLPAPEPGAVDPNWGWNGEVTDVRIRGAGFYPRIQASGARDVAFDRQFRVWLVGDTRVELDRVDFRSDDELAAEVPAGVPAGRYDLEVVGPGGDVGLLRAAYTVTDSRADRIELAATDLNWPVYSLARLDIQLAGPDGLDVPDDLEIDVFVRGVDDPGTVRFEDTLDEQSLMVDLDDGRVGVRGLLGPDGGGHLTFTSTAPTELWIDVAPADPTSVIAGASQFLAFTPANAVAIEIAPVDPGQPIEAGAPFDLRVSLVDRYGNVVGDASAGATLFESCAAPGGRYTGSTTVVGSTILEGVVLNGASAAGGGDTCATNRIDAIGNVFGSTINGRSDDLAVSPGPVDAYAVTAWPTVVEAGEDDVLVQVRATDSVGNTVTEHAAELALSDSLGGLAWGPAAWSCGAFTAGSAACAARPVSAGAAVVITAQSDAASGDGSPIRVEPSTPTGLLLDGPGAAQAAGSGFTAELRAVDDWGNGVSLDILGVDLPAFTDGGGAVGCSWLTSGAPTGTERFECVPTRAESDKVLTAAIPSRGLLAASLPFEVTNGPLAQVTVTPAQSAVTAGDELSFSLRAQDAWGNAYRVQAVTSVLLTDLSGDIVGQTAALDAGGLATWRGRFTTAREANTIRAVASGATVGTSPGFDVLPDDPTTLSVSVGSTWAWIDEPRAVTVTALDAYANPADSFSGSVTLSSVGGAGDPVTVSGFIAGQAVAAFTWGTPSLQDTLAATDGDLSGTSGAVDAVEPCTDGPTAALSVGGASELVLCRSGGVTASTTLSSAGSIAGGGAIVATHFAPEPDAFARSTTSSTAATWSDEGSWLASALVVDANACGALATARLWVADNDGEPAGPITAAVVASELVAGSAVSGTTAVDLSATDCAGDPAAGGTLHARVTLGALASRGSTLLSTGDGLAVVLDGNGDANLSWSVLATRHAGTGALHVGRPGGQAYGGESVGVTGDAALPVVIDVSPVGSTAASFSALTIDFSEPMLASTLGTSTVALTDGDGVAASIAPSLSANGEVLTLALPASRDAGAGVWTLAVGSTARDAAGNRLDGAYSGASGAFAIDFGAVTDAAPDVSTCALSVSELRPDGDAGAGSAADTVSMSATATATPAWWELEVTDLQGDLVYLWRTAGVASTATLTWNAREQNGPIADNGDYTITVTALDDSWNAGASCVQDLALANRIHAPE